MFLCPPPIGQSLYVAAPLNSDLRKFPFFEPVFPHLTSNHLSMCPNEWKRELRLQEMFLWNWNRKDSGQFVLQPPPDDHCGFPTSLTQSAKHKFLLEPCQSPLINIVPTYKFNHIMKSHMSNGKTVTQKVYVIRILNNCHSTVILSIPQQQMVPLIWKGARLGQRYCFIHQPPMEGF